MANTPQATTHILQRIIPFESEAFRVKNLELTTLPMQLSGYFQLLHLGPLTALNESTLELFLRLEGTGSVHFRVKGLSDGNNIEVLTEATLDLSTNPVHRFQVPQSSLKGVAYLEVSSQAQGSRLQSAEWGLMREASQLRPPQLVIASCTFNRQKEILRTIESIQSSETFAQGRIDLIVIDNGSNLELPSELKNPRLRVIGQRNLGGAGGFTRGMIEATKFEAMTHVLLMDDDVEVSPEVIDRLARWLMVLPKDVSVSGAMLDAYQRSVLYEAGARFISHTFEVKPDYNHIQLAQVEKASSELSRTSTADYGAWWFFAFPKEALEKAGLPLPVFIRGDDIEFGVRLKSLGFRTLVIHGLAVWHEPFYLKRAIWPMYYAIRNFTLINGVHFKTPARMYIASVAKMFIQFLLRYDYGAGAAIERGLSDFLKGPEFLLQPGDATHKSVTTYLADYQCENLTKAQVDELKSKSQAEVSAVRHPLRAVTINGHLLPALKRTPQILDHEYVSWRWLTTDAYLQVNATTGAGQLFKKDSVKFWTLVTKMTKTLALATLCFDKRCADYRANFGELTSERSWRTYLGMPTAQER